MAALRSRRIAIKCYHSYYAIPLRRKRQLARYFVVATNPRFGPELRALPAALIRPFPRAFLPFGNDSEEEIVQWTILLRLDISMDETHVCVLDWEGEVVRESKTVSTAQAIADEWVKALGCRRIVSETGRSADPISWVPRARSRCLRREPAGLPGAGLVGDPQD